MWSFGSISSMKPENISPFFLVWKAGWPDWHTVKSRVARLAHCEKQGGQMSTLQLSHPDSTIIAQFFSPNLSRGSRHVCRLAWHQADKLVGLLGTRPTNLSACLCPFLFEELGYCQLCLTKTFAFVLFQVFFNKLLLTLFETIKLT
jgi:hypothetical protein